MSDLGVAPAAAYAGVPIREREARAVVPRGHRRLTKERNRANKENMLSRTKTLRAQFDADIDRIADDTSIPKSVVARNAYNKGAAKRRGRRAVNPLNAWAAAELGLINQSKSFFI